MQATLIFGDPKTPCSGSGICDLQALTASNDAYLPLAHNICVDVAVNAGTNYLIISIPPKSIRMVMDMTKLLNESMFYTTSDFYIDKSLNSLFPHADENDWILIKGGQSCPVKGPNIDNTYTFVVLFDLKYSKNGGLVGDIINQSTLCSSTNITPWQIGTDFYDNLVFKNPNNTIILGAAGNLRIQGLNVQTSNMPDPTVQSTQQSGNVVASVVIAGDWIITFWDNWNVLISNGLNQLFFILNESAYLNSCSINQGTPDGINIGNQFSGPGVTLGSSNGLALCCGTDNNGNLAFYVNDTENIIFGMDTKGNIQMNNYPFAIG